MGNEIVILGASGFVGRNVAKYYIRQGWTVVGLSRTNPEIEGMQYRKFDLLNDRDIETGEYCSSTIVNCAATASNTARKEAYEVNSTGAVNATHLNPDGKLIHISSSSIYNMRTRSRNVTEDEFSVDGYHHYSLYSHTKALAEQSLLQSDTYRTLAPVSLRPHAVYGRDDTTLLPKLVERIKTSTIRLPGKYYGKQVGRMLLPDAGLHQHSLTNIDNLIQAVDKAVTYAGVNEQVEAFNITDAYSTLLYEAIYMYTLFEQGLSHLIVKNISTQKLEKLRKLVPKIIGEYELKQVGYERTYNIEKAKTLLKYNPTGFLLN
jgi:nucleoside-diphosphate-sugar epimerase